MMESIIIIVDAFFVIIIIIFIFEWHIVFLSFSNLYMV